MLPDERRLRIIEQLAQQRSITVSELSTALGVSESTIRRDLDELEQQGLLRRTHGGAVAIDATAAFEPTLQEKDVRHTAEKRAIAKAAAKLVRAGDAVLLDAGTTTLHIARAIAAMDITILTNSVPIAADLVARPDLRAQLIVLGGWMRTTTGALVGPFTERMLGELHADVVFLGANGLHLERGVTTPHPFEAAVKAAMVKSARRVVVAADRSKWNQASLVRVCNWDAVDVWVTDAAPVQAVEELAQRGVQVVQASEGSTRTEPHDRDPRDGAAPGESELHDQE
jgi:DeoR family fructose operon transcriptional repressor